MFAHDVLKHLIWQEAIFFYHIGYLRHNGLLEKSAEDLTKKVKRGNQSNTMMDMTTLLKPQIYRHSYNGLGTCIDTDGPDMIFSV